MTSQATSFFCSVLAATSLWSATPAWASDASAGDDATQGFIGVVLEQRDDASITVREVLSNGPAAAAGLKADDQIVAIDGEPTDGFDLATVADLLRGDVGTTVIVEIARDDVRFSVRLRRVAFDSIAPPRTAAPSTIVPMSCEFDNRAADGPHVIVNLRRAADDRFDFEAVYEAYGWGGQDGRPSEIRREDHISDLTCVAEDPGAVTTCENAAGQRVVVAYWETSSAPSAERVSLTWSSQNGTRGAEFNTTSCSATESFF